MMKREYIGFLLVFMVLGFLLSGCNSTQPGAAAKKESTQYKYVDNYANNNEQHYYKKLGLTRYEYFGEVENYTTDLRKYGAYYTGDGGHFPLIIDVLVYKNKVNEAIKEINKLNNLISSVQMHDGKYTCQAYSWYDTFLSQSADDAHHYIGLQKNINLNNTVCLTVKSYPGLEPYATLSLRKLDIVLYALRPGFAAGGAVAVIPVENFETKGEDYLQKQNQLDNVKLTKNQDTSLKSNFVNKK